jgi:hypothetical protein
MASLEMVHRIDQNIGPRSRMSLRLTHPRETKISGFLAELFDARSVKRIGDNEVVGGSINI